jgi:type IV fimbrial biogenesis protein FimT
MVKRESIRGFSLTELMVAMAVFVIIAIMAIPNISEWISKAKIRASAEALQNSIRLAQSEAAKRNRLIEFSLVNSPIPPMANESGYNTDVASDNGTAWVIRIVPLPTEDAASRPFLQGDVFSQSGIQLKGGSNKTLVFGGIGQVYTNVPNSSVPAPVLPTIRAYHIVSSGDKYPLCVLVQPGGGVRWCDPSLTSGDRSCPGSTRQSCL